MSTDPAATLGYDLDTWAGDASERVVLEQELAVSHDQPQRQAALLYELARLDLAAGDSASAAQVLLRSFGADATFRPTIWLARAIYERRDNPQLVLQLLDAELRTGQSQSVQAALLRQQARVLWLRLGQTSAAKEKLHDALALADDDLATLKLLHVLQAAIGDSEGRRETVGRLIGGLPEGPWRTALRVDSALLQSASDPAGAVDALLDAERAEPGSFSLQLWIELLCERAGDHTQLVEVLERQSRLAGADPLWRARRLARAASICRGQLAQLEMAHEFSQRARAVRPDYAIAVDGYDLLLTLGLHAEALSLGAELIEMEPSAAERAARACELGDLCRVQLQDPARAADWYRTCLAQAPTYQPALESLSLLLEASGDLDGLLQIQRADLEVTTEARQRALRLYRIGSLLERHERLPAAVDAYLEALQEAGRFRPALLATERLLLHAERWVELVALYEQQLSRDHEPEHQRYLLERIAELLCYQVGDPERALAYYVRLLEHSPRDLRLLRTAARLAADTQRWRQLVELTQREIALTHDGPRRADLLHRAGALWDERLHDAEQATAAFRAALAQDPEYLPALRALGRLYSRRELWRELIAMHRAELQVCSDEQQISALLHAIADTYEHRLDDAEQAATAYRELLRRQPGYPPALAALQRLLSAQRRWSELAELLELAVESTRLPAAQAATLCRIAQLRWERLGDQAGASADCWRALRVSADYLPAQLLLLRLFEVAPPATPNLAPLAAAIERNPDGELRRQLTEHLAWVVDRGGKDPRLATQLYERAAAADPPPWLLWTLLQAQRRLGTASDADAVLQRIVASSAASPERSDLQLEVAITSQGAAAARLSAALWESVSAAEQPFARRLAERHLRAAESEDNADALMRLLRHRAELTHDDNEAACLLTELGDRLATGGQSAAAEAAYRAALQRAPLQLNAILGLQGLLAQQERWAELIAAFEDEAACCEAPQHAADAWVHAAQTVQERLGDLEGAARRYERALQLQPSHAQAFAQLAALLRDRGQWDELADLIRTQISLTAHDVTAARLLTELGRIQLEQLGEPQPAEACLRRVNEIEPNNLYALLTRGDIYYQRREWRRALEVYDRAEGLAADDSTRDQILRRLGEIHLNLGAALPALEALRRLPPHDLSADAGLLRQLARAARAAQDPDAEHDALERLATATEDPAERIEARRQLALLTVRHVGDLQAAALAWERVLALDPLDAEANESLASIYQTTGNHTALYQQLRAAVAHHRAALQRQPRNVAFHRQLAALLRRQHRFDAAYCTCCALGALTTLDLEEAAFIERHLRLCNLPSAAEFTNDDYRRLLLPEAAQGLLRDFLQRSAPALAVLSAERPAKYGLTRRNRLDSKHPFAQALSELAPIVGAPEFELWISPRDPNCVQATHFEQPALVIGSQVVGGGLEPRQRFRIGQALLLLAEHGLLFAGREEAALPRLLADLAAAALPIVEYPPALLEQARRGESGGEARFAKRLSKDARRGLGLLLPRLFAHLTAAEVAAFGRAQATAADRAGLLLAGDPAVALQALGEASDDPPLLAPLLQFLISEEYGQLRRKCGIAAVGT
ncbi:MAG: hypothetical protein IPL40_15955 [Proteobacteria bacterium]|nr:hypothetical protein [Pseudomonadota bacterium]